MTTVIFGVLLCVYLIGAVVGFNMARVWCVRAVRQKKMPLDEVGITMLMATFLWPFYIITVMLVSFYSALALIAEAVVDVARDVFFDSIVRDAQSDE